MKAMVVSPVGGRVPPTRGVLHNGLVGGGVGGLNGSRRDMEAEEVAAYLTKLRSLVPDMPRKRKLSKLEVIQRVIEYICDLQTTLEETNVPGGVVAAGEKISPSQIRNNNNNNNNNNSNNSVSCNQLAQRQPLQPLLNAASSTMQATSSNSSNSSSTLLTTTTTTTTMNVVETSTGSSQR